MASSCKVFITMIRLGYKGYVQYIVVLTAKQYYKLSTKSVTTVRKMVLANAAGNTYLEYTLQDNMQTTSLAQ